MAINKPKRGLFITGTNTGVGKTHVAALIAKSLVRKGFKVGVYKPVASGCVVKNDTIVSEDARRLWEAAGRPLDVEAVCPQRFQAALAPHLAARSENRQIDSRLLRDGLSVWENQCDIVLVEGAGGLMSPISDDEFVAELAAEFGYPLIVVAANELGTINQTLQTLITAETFSGDLKVAGIVLNDVRAETADQSVTSNRAELERLAVPPILAHVNFGMTELADEIDWLKLADSR